MSGINPNTKKKIVWRAGHHTKRQNVAAQARAARARAAWPTKERIEELLAELGTRAAVARELGIKETTFKHVVVQLGIAYRPHGSSMPKSTIRFGWSGEDHAALILGAESNRGPTANDDYDVTWRGKRVEVKTSRPVRAGAGQDWFWMFQLARSQGKCDAFFCIGCSEEGLPRAYFLVPAEVAPKTKLSVPMTLRSKWAEYLWTPPEPPLPAWLA